MYFQLFRRFACRTSVRLLAQSIDCLVGCKTISVERNCSIVQIWYSRYFGEIVFGAEDVIEEEPEEPVKEAKKTK